MKKKIRDSVVLLVSMLGIAWIYRALVRRNGPLVRVICFHDVPDRAWFENVIDLLTSEFQVITPQQFYDQDFNPDRINVVLTFDDGYQSWIDNCLPVLREHDCKALFFINSGLLDVSHDPEASARFMRDCIKVSSKEPLTWEGAKQLVAEGHSIGGHTRSHISVAGIPMGEAMVEISNDKKRHEDMLSILLTDFAYPFGIKRDLSSQTLEWVSQAGYVRQYSAITGFWNGSHELIPRTLLERNQPMRQVRRWVNGGYDIFSSLKR